MPFSPKKLTERMAECGTDDVHLAGVVGCKANQVKQWEVGYVAPSARFLERIANALGCRIDDLFEAEAGE
jgi:transcriptional regulator with XRE-family HTH domain